MIFVFVVIGVGCHLRAGGCKITTVGAKEQMLNPRRGKFVVDRRHSYVFLRFISIRKFYGTAPGGLQAARLVVQRAMTLLHRRHGFQKDARQAVPAARPQREHSDN
jgi:hypothetical protein